MDILDNINWIELLFILILGLILFGPEKLPAIGAEMGRYTHKLQRLSAQFLAQWREEVVDPIKEARASVLEAQALAPAIGESDYEPAKPGPEKARPGRPAQTLVERVAELERQVRELQATLAVLEAERLTAPGG